jgi:DNA-binding transcriptional LysR family regulator
VDILDLVVFTSVAQAGSISRGAAELRLAQPSVSTRIQNLEGELGKPLFLRTRRGVELTDSGRQFLPYATRCLALLEEGKEVVRVATGQLRLRLGAPPSIAQVMFPRLLRLLEGSSVEVWTYAENSPQVMQMLLDGLIDAGIRLYGPTLHGLRWRVLERIPIYCVVGAGHPLTNLPHGTYGLAELIQHKIAIYSWGDGSEDLRQRLHAIGGSKGGYAKVTPAEVARQLVIEAGVISFLPEVVIRNDLAEGRVVRLHPYNFPEYEWKIALLYRDRKQQNPALKCLLSVLGLSSLNSA